MVHRMSVLRIAAVAVLLGAWIAALVVIGLDHAVLHALADASAPDIAYAFTLPTGFTVACFEVARSTLVVDTTDDGCVVGEMRHGSPIKNATLDEVVANAATFNTGRRGGLIQWAVRTHDSAGTPITTHAATTTSTSFASPGTVFALPLPILARQRYRSETTRTVRARVYGWCTAGSIEVRFTTSRSGTTSSTASTASTTPAWIDAIDFAVDVDDLSTATGLRSGSFDEVQCEFRQTAAGAVYVGAVSIWEND